jgi:hypothetical protein
MRPSQNKKNIMVSGGTFACKKQEVENDAEPAEEARPNKVYYILNIY